MRTQNTLVLAASAAALFGMMAQPAVAVTWTGGGSGTNWNETANWGGALPGPTDEAKFTSTGLASNRVVVMGAAQTVSSLAFDTTTFFTIGNAAGNTAGHTLTIANVDRSAGSSGTQTIRADVTLAADSAWTVNGSGLLNIYKLTGSGKLDKWGTGDLRLNDHSTLRTGATVVSQGTLSVAGSGLNVAGSGQLGSGNVVVGNGTDTALFQLRYGNDWNLNLIGDSAAVAVNSNAVFDLETYYTAAGGRSDTIASLTVAAGGLAKLGKFTLYMGGYSSTNVMMKGGAITGSAGSISPVSGFVVVDPSATEMATISTGVKVSQKYSGGSLYTRFLVGDPAGVPVDLKCNGAMVNIWDLRDGFDKIGPGVMKITGSSTYGGKSTTEGCTRVQAGTLLVDNTTGTGTGRSYVPVSPGATLGGVGTIGGDSTSSNANVVVTGASGNLATLAPGSIDETTGSHIFGTLTVGSSTQTNNVTLGNYSRLRVNVSATGSQDRLTVNGVLNLASASDTLEVVVPAETKAGNYILASATGGIMGTFNTVIALPTPSMRISYTATTVVLTVPPEGTRLLLR